MTIRAAHRAQPWRTTAHAGVKQALVQLARAKRRPRLQAHGLAAEALDANRVTAYGAQPVPGSTLAGARYVSLRPRSRQKNFAAALPLLVSMFSWNAQKPMLSPTIGTIFLSLQVYRIIGSSQPSVIYYY